ncbi:MAG TPA: wax ester/triacylglycerol synthase family O-acyltransferase [Terriglobales bacterium]|nr:wax ester/triacylglycerol synthase family O-acyltransferase [Terriglobales bacterium]
MTTLHNGDHLSWGDALFLYLERAGMPMNIASVSVFEGEISLADCIKSMEAKLPLLPRYYQRVVTPPWNLGFPSWEQDPEFDISNHMREVTLKHGTEGELKTLAGKILSTMMDRQRPLWDFTVVHGLKGDRSAVMMRIHHCLADGIAGVGLMNVLMGSEPEGSVVGSRKTTRVRRCGRQKPQGLLDAGLSSYSDMVERILKTYSDVTNLSLGMAATSGDWPMEEFQRLLPELTAPTERLFFNTTYQGPQKFTWAKIPLAEIKAVREKWGGTHNDLVVALITSAIGRYAELHGDRIKGRLLRMMVPVSVRGNDSASELGNRISILPVNVPLGIRNTRKLFAAVHRRIDFLKRSHMAEMVGMAGGLLGLVPAPLQALVGPFASLLPVTPFNLVCTNIRGPQTPLYLAGRKMVDWYPYVPIGGEMTVNCAVLSYNDFTYFGFSGDAQVAPDLGRLEKFLRLSFEEMRRAAGVRTSRRKKSAEVEPLAPVPQRRVRRTLVIPARVNGRERSPAPSPTPAQEKKQPPPMAAD